MNINDVLTAIEEEEQKTIALITAEFEKLSAKHPHSAAIKVVEPDEEDEVREIIFELDDETAVFSDEFVAAWLSSPVLNELALEQGVGMGYRIEKASTPFIAYVEFDFDGDEDPRF